MNVFDKFIEVWGRVDLADDIGERLRCEELDRLVEIFRFFGEDDIADKWVAAHAIGDDCDDQHCACVHCNGGEQACAECGELFVADAMVIKERHRGGDLELHCEGCVDEM